MFKEISLGEQLNMVLGEVMTRFSLNIRSLIRKPSQFSTGHYSKCHVNKAPASSTKVTDHHSPTLLLCQGRHSLCWGTTLQGLTMVCLDGLKWNTGSPWLGGWLHWLSKNLCGLTWQGLLYVYTLRADQATNWFFPSFLHTDKRFPSFSFFFFC